MSTFRLLPITLAVLAGTACNPFHREPAVEVSARDDMLNSRWHATLASPATLAGVVQMNGSASMAPDVDRTHTVVIVDLANASPGGLHPWEMREGRCGFGNDYGLVGSAESYDVLKVGDDGRATARATIATRTPQSGDYFVVVHASQANSGTVVACGNLAPPTR